MTDYLDCPIRAVRYYKAQRYNQAFSNIFKKIAFSVPTVPIPPLLLSF